MQVWPLPVCNYFRIQPDICSRPAGNGQAGRAVGKSVIEPAERLEPVNERSIFDCIRKNRKIICKSLAAFWQLYCLRLEL